MKQDELNSEQIKEQIEAAEKHLCDLKIQKQKIIEKERNRWKPPLTLEEISFNPDYTSLSPHPFQAQVQNDLDQKFYLDQLARSLNEDWKPDWSDGIQGKWHILYSHGASEWQVECVWRDNIPGVAHFKDEAAANKAVEIVKNEPLMKL